MSNPFIQGLKRYLSDETLEQIQKQKIGIGGAGGLGSNIAITLVRSGFQNIEMLDFDIIESSNLNRQQYFINEIGQSKIQTLKKRLLDINPDLNLTIHDQQWQTKNGLIFFKNCNIIIEAFDQALFKSQFVEFYQDKCDFIVSGNGMAGLIDKKEMFVQKIGNIFFVGDQKTDTADGHPPMAPRVVMCAAQMAEIVLDLTLALRK